MIDNVFALISTHSVMHLALSIYMFVIKTTKLHERVEYLAELKAK